MTVKRDGVTFVDHTDDDDTVIDVRVIGSVPVTGFLTDTELRANPVPIVGIVSVNEPVEVEAVNFDIRNLVFATDRVDISGSTGVGVVGPLTNTELRATPVPISGTVNTKTNLIPSVPTSIIVGVASIQVVAANANRKGLIFVNTSNRRISLGFGATAVLDNGVTLFPESTYKMGEFDFYTGVVRAIASGNNSNLAIQEYS